MDNERWQRVKTLYQAALEHPAAARPAFVRENCDDEALVAQVLELLDVPVTGADRLDSIVEKSADELRHAFAIGERIGAYRLIDVIGQGGMGHVYLAERADDEYDQQVAIKVVNWLGASPTLIDRFQLERQILAGLEHPYIARMLDGGRATSGIPYLVMEYVEGESITQFASNNRLSVDARLELFLKICEAVQYAHRKLVVHRDIKPSNVLIAADGTPKLLDFGIAKFLDENDDTALTRADARILTPEYASPEQLTGMPVTTATDVYGLGLMLYQLLAEALPFDLTNKTSPQIHELICRTSPTAPSKAVAKDGASEFVARLRGDLDNIVLMALRKEPERRYESVAALAADVRNHLAKRPVQARHPSLAYRAGRFIARNRGAVMASLFTVALLIGSSSYYTWQLAKERDLARLQADRAEQIATFLTDLFAEADPAENLGEPLTVRELLDSGASRVAEDLAAQPALQATLMVTIARSYENMEENVAAREYLTAALPQIEQSLGNDHPDVLQLRSLLGLVMSHTGQAEQAKALLEENYAQLVYAYGPGSLASTRELTALAVVEQKLGNYERSEELYRDAIARFRTLGPGSDGDLARSLIDLGSVLRRQDRGDEEEPMLLEALAIQERLVGKSHPDYASVLNNLGNHYYRRGDHARARTFMQENVALHLQLYGEEAIPYGGALVNYASLLRAEGEEERAAQMYFEALPIFAKGFGSDSPRYAYLLENLANSLVDVERYGEAEQYYEQSLAILAEHFGTDHAEYAFTLRNRGVAFGRMGRPAQALPDLEQSIEIWVAAYGENYSRVVTTRNALAQNLLDLGRWEDAARPGNLALDSLRGDAVLAADEQHFILRTNAKIRSAAGDHDAAQLLFEEAIALADGLQASRERLLVATELEFAESLVTAGQRERAIDRLRALDARLTAADDVPEASYSALQDALRNLER